MKDLVNDITKKDLRLGYRCLKRAIDFYIRQHKVCFVANKIAPNKYKDMLAYYRNHGDFLVYDGGDHGYLGKQYNIKFRAIHDHGHMQHNLRFTFEDEKKLSLIQAQELFDICYSELNMTIWEALLVKVIVWAEIGGQIEYYEKHGEFVADQAEYITEYLEVVA